MPLIQCVDSSSTFTCSRSHLACIRASAPCRALPPYAVTPILSQQLAIHHPAHVVEPWGGTTGQVRRGVAGGVLPRRGHLLVRLRRHLHRRVRPRRPGAHALPPRPPRPAPPAPQARTPSAARTVREARASPIAAAAALAARLRPGPDRAGAAAGKSPASVGAYNDPHGCASARARARRRSPALLERWPGHGVGGVRGDETYLDVRVVAGLGGGEGGCGWTVPLNYDSYGVCCVSDSKGTRYLWTILVTRVCI